MTDAATAWTTVYLQHRNALQAYAFALCGQPEPAADLLQDVLLKLIDAGPPGEQSKAYLMRAMRNRAIDQFRRPGLGDQPLPDDLLAAVDPDPLARAEQLTQLRRAVERLDGTQREVIVLKTFTACSFAEIAEILELPAGTVASHYRRGLDHLRSLMTENDCDPRTTGAMAERPADPPASS